MNFKKISDNTSCNCFLNTNENITDTFVRKVRRSGNLNDPDFRNNIERGKVVEDQNDCETVCGSYGVSIELWNDQSAPLLMNKYRQTVIISPQLKKNLCVIKLKSDCGIIKYTPNQVEEYNEFHYDFYKDDDFVVGNLELVEMIQLKVV